MRHFRAHAPNNPPEVLRGEVSPEPLNLAERHTAASPFGLAPKLLFAFSAHGLTAVIGVVVVPVYLRLMGPEAYGLVGFYVALQGWLVLLDLGLSPTLARQLSLFKAGALSAKDAAGLVKATELVFAAIAGGVAALFALAGGWFARRWLGASTLSAEQVTFCLRLLGLLLAARWMAVLYHAALTGLEKQNTLNVIVLLGTLGRAIAAICALHWLSPSPVTFFAAQFALTLIEAAACRAALAGTLAATGPRLRPAWSLLARETRFAGALAVASAIWVAVNQADKLALSHFLTLKAFGYFSLTAVICSGITMVAPPLTQMIYPRLTYLLAQGRDDEFIQLYRLSNSLMMVIAVAVAGTIAAHPDLVFLAWTGSRQSADLGLVLTLYALGTGISLYLMIPYLLQYAYGMLRLHVIGNLALGIVWIPAAILSAKHLGAFGTGLTWFVGNALFVLVWIPVVHHRLLSADQRTKVERNLYLKGGLFALLMACTAALPTDGLGRWAAFLVLALVASATMLAGVLAFEDLRSYVTATLCKARSALGRPR